MNPFAAVAVKVAGGGAAALLSLELAGGLAQAADPTPSPSPTATTGPATPDTRADRRAVAAAVFVSEADVLGIKPEQLRADLKQGQKVSDLAKAKGMTREQFTVKLIANLRPRMEQLIDHKVIIRAQADRVIDWISKGHIPFWDGIHHKR